MIREVRLRADATEEARGAALLRAAEIVSGMKQAGMDPHIAVVAVGAVDVIHIEAVPVSVEA